MIKRNGIPFMGGRTRDYVRLDEMPATPKKKNEYRCKCGYGPLRDDGSERAKAGLCLACWSARNGDYAG